MPERASGPARSRSSRAQSRNFTSPVGTGQLGDPDRLPLDPIAGQRSRRAGTRNLYRKRSFRRAH
jgi:hypothetical protein